MTGKWRREGRKDSLLIKSLHLRSKSRDCLYARLHRDSLIEPSSSPLTVEVSLQSFATQPIRESATGLIIGPVGDKSPIRRVNVSSP